jgi:hypothetical protein
MAPAMCRTMSTALVVGSPVNIGTNKSTYQLLSDEQKARFNAIAPADNRNAAAKDQHDLTKLCDEKTSGATGLPIDRIAQVQPAPPQRPALDELNDASVQAAEQYRVPGLSNADPDRLDRGYGGATGRRARRSEDHAARRPHHPWIEALIRRSSRRWCDLACRIEPAVSGWR